MGSQSPIGLAPGGGLGFLPGSPEFAAVANVLGEIGNLSVEPLTVNTEYNYTQTVLNNVGSRPYINSPSLINEIQSSGLGVPDPGGRPNASDLIFLVILVDLMGTMS